MYHNWVFILLHEFSNNLYHSVTNQKQEEKNQKSKSERRKRKCFHLSYCIHRLAERLWHLCTSHQECPDLESPKHIQVILPSSSDHVMPGIWVYTHSLYQGMYCCSQQVVLFNTWSLSVTYGRPVGFAYDTMWSRFTSNGLIRTLYTGILYMCSKA